MVRKWLTEEERKMLASGRGPSSWGPLTNAEREHSWDWRNQTESLRNDPEVRAEMSDAEIDALIKRNKIKNNKLDAKHEDSVMTPEEYEKTFKHTNGRYQGMYDEQVKLYEQEKMLYKYRGDSNFGKNKDGVKFNKKGNGDYSKKEYDAFVKKLRASRIVDEYDRKEANKKPLDVKNNISKPMFDEGRSPNSGNGRYNPPPNMDLSKLGLPPKIRKPNIMEGVPSQPVEKELPLAPDDGSDAYIVPDSRGTTLKDVNFNKNTKKTNIMDEFNKNQPPVQQQDGSYTVPDIKSQILNVGRGPSNMSIKNLMDIRSSNNGGPKKLNKEEEAAVSVTPERHTDVNQDEESQKKNGTRPNEQYLARQKEINSWDQFNKKYYTSGDAVRNFADRANIEYRPPEPPAAPIVTDESRLKQSRMSPEQAYQNLKEPIAGEIFPPRGSSEDFVPPVRGGGPEQEYKNLKEKLPGEPDAKPFMVDEDNLPKTPTDKENREAVSKGITKLITGSEKQSPVGTKKIGGKTIEGSQDPRTEYDMLQGMKDEINKISNIRTGLNGMDYTGAYRLIQAMNRPYGIDSSKNITQEIQRKKFNDLEKAKTLAVLKDKLVGRQIDLRRIKASEKSSEDKGASRSWLDKELIKGQLKEGRSDRAYFRAQSQEISEKAMKNTHGVTAKYGAITKAMSPVYKAIQGGNFEEIHMTLSNFVRSMGEKGNLAASDVDRSFMPDLRTAVDKIKTYFRTSASGELVIHPDRQDKMLRVMDSTLEGLLGSANLQLDSARDVDSLSKYADKAELNSMYGKAKTNINSYGKTFRSIEEEKKRNTPKTIVSQERDDRKAKLHKELGY